MKLFLAAFVAIGSCLFLTQTVSGQELPTTLPPPPQTGGNARFFFNFGSSDPCTNRIYQFLNITDAKCSLQCYIQAGLQQGGYCDDDSVCQCNQIS